MNQQGVPASEVEALAPSFLAPTSMGERTDALSVYAFREEPPAWLEDTCARIRELLNLPGDWDSYGAAPVNRWAAEHAQVLIGSLARFVGITQPTVTATPDGEVGFCWDAGDWSLDASVDCSGLISYVFLDEQDSRNEQEGRTRNTTDLAAFLTRW